MPADKPKIYHIFDVDKTILNASTVKDLLFRCIRNGVIPFCILFYLPYFFIIFSIFGVKEAQFIKPFRCLKGLSEEQLNKVAREVYEDNFRKRIFPEIIELMRNIRANDDEIIIASASFNFILKPLAEDLSIDQIICSEIEFTDGVSTGRMIGLPAFQKGKQLRVHQYLEKRRIDFSDCSFYTDSHRDLSLLQAVGRAVAVNPDKRLRHTAVRRGWEIIETTGAVRRKIWQIS